MNRRDAILTLLALPGIAFAQSASALPRVAILHLGTSETDKQERLAFVQGMREQGYTDGKNMLLNETFIAGRDGSLREIIGEILGRKPAVLVVGGSQAVHAAKAATTTVPIVVYSMADPVGQGVVQSLARPGGNITGIAILSEVLVAKRLEILLEVVPGAKRIGYLANPQNPVASALFGHASAAAKKRGVELIAFNATTPGELDETLKGITRQHIHALLLSQDVTAFTYRKKIAEALARNRMPAMHGFPQNVEDGGLMSYSANIGTRRYAASFVRRILQGAKPGDLPFEQPTEMALVVNLKAAKALGIAFPQSILLRADRVIE